MPRPALRTLVPYLLGVLIAGFLPIPLFWIWLIALICLIGGVGFSYLWKTDVRAAQVGLDIPVGGDLCLWHVPSGGCTDLTYSLRTSMISRCISQGRWRISQNGENSGRRAMQTGSIRSVESPDLAGGGKAP